MAGIYLHFPFCIQKCNYCDFFSDVLDNRLPQYVEAVKKEIVLRGKDSNFKDLSYTTLYFGGGTPSLLDPSQVDSILKTIQSNFSLTEDAEITIEINPGTVTPKKLRDYQALGINRLSIGIQSLNDKELKLMGRIHNSEEAQQSISWAREAGFKNISLDFIYGLPSQTWEDFQQSLQKAVAFEPQHLSLYALSWSEQTKLGLKIIEQSVPKPMDIIVGMMQRLAAQVLTSAGYHHYEISNYALPGFECLHNLKYWQSATYLGLGPSSHSFIQNERFWNVPDIPHYLESLSKDEFPIEDSELLSDKEKNLEKIALGLRTFQGVSLELLDESEEKVKDLIDNRLAYIEDNRFILKEDGFLLADEIAVQLS